MLLAQPVEMVDQTTSPRWLSRYSALADMALRVFDVIVVLSTAMLSYWSLFGQTFPPAHYRIAIGFVVLYAVLSFNFLPLYRSWRGRKWSHEILVLSLAWIMAFVLFSAHLFVMQWEPHFDRQWLGMWFVAGVLTLAGSRVLLRSGLDTLRENGVDVQHVVVVGLRHPILRAHQYIHRHPWMGIDMMGYLSTQHDMVNHQTPHALAPLGTIHDLERVLTAGGVNQVWISLPLGDRDGLKEILKVLDHHPVQIKFFPDLYDVGLLNQSGGHFGGVPIINLRESATDKNTYFVVAKAVQDKIVAATALLLLWPIFLAIGLAVKVTSPGPVFFRQARHGLNGREFGMLKFRSMTHNNTDVRQATKNDARVTKVGAFLRRTSLDELPQFINVLKGDMSVVGPRPHATAHNSHYEKLINKYMQRHYVKPGITGWAQINGFRGETPELRTMKKRIQYDLDYIRRWTLWLDIKIIAITAVKAWTQKTAY